MPAGMSNNQLYMLCWLVVNRVRQAKGLELHPYKADLPCGKGDDIYTDEILPYVNRGDKSDDERVAGI